MQITNAATGAVLSTQTISSFSGGAYLNYEVSGEIRITITDQAGPNAVLNGLFLDPAQSSGAVALLTVGGPGGGLTQGSSGDPSASPMTALGVTPATSQPGQGDDSQGSSAPAGDGQNVGLTIVGIASAGAGVNPTVTNADNGTPAGHARGDHKTLVLHHSRGQVHQPPSRPPGHSTRRKATADPARFVVAPPPLGNLVLDPPLPRPSHRSRT